MLSRIQRPLFVALATLPLLAALACGGTAPVTPTPKPTANAVPVNSPSPEWTRGEYPKEDAFFGHAMAPVQGTEQEAIAQARERAIGNIKAELAILNKFVKTDHEEQVAEIITRYPTEDFNRIADASMEKSLDAAAVAATWTDQSTSPPVLHVLFKLSADDYYDALFASELPDEQKTRVRNYGSTFTTNVMTNLGRR